MKTKAQYIDLLKNPYIKAGLDTIAKCEGVKYGYKTLYGNTAIDSLAAHPNKKVTKWGITSTAAGRYQFLFRTWEAIRKKYLLPDFNKQSQDIAALVLLDEKGALDLLAKGDVLGAFYKARKVWASFPSAGYGQGERKQKFVIDTFNKALAKPSDPAPSNNEKNDPIILGGLILLAYLCFS